MSSNRVSPSGDQSSVFKEDTAILLPESDTNLIVSFYDYRILKDLENFLVDKTNLFSDDDFSIDPSDNPVVLGLKNPLNVFRLFFLRLSKFNFKIDNQGINFLISLCTPILNLDQLQATLHAEQETKTNSLYQNINLTLTEINSPPINKTYPIIFTVVLLLDLGGIGFFLSKSIVGAVIGVIIALICSYLMYRYVKNNVETTVKPSLFTITIFTLLLMVYFIIRVRPSSNILVNLIKVFIAIVIGVILYILINNKVAKLAYRAIHNFLTGFDKSVKFNNPNFTINDIVYNQAIIVQGLFGNAAVEMSLINPDTNNQIVYQGYEAKLNIQLTNNSGSAIGLNTGTTNQTEIQIEMPSFLSNDLAPMNIELTGWSYSLVDSTLILTNVSATSWEPGADNAIQFEITGITSSYSSTATDFVKVNIANTVYTNELQLQARLSNSTSAPPKIYTIYWEVTYNSSNGLEPFNSPTSGTAQVTSQSNEFIVLASTELSDGTLDYYLGYQFNTSGLQAGWAQTVPNTGSNPAVIYRWNGLNITPENPGSDNYSQSYYQNQRGSSEDPNTNINIYFESSNNEE